MKFLSIKKAVTLMSLAVASLVSIQAAQALDHDGDGKADNMVYRLSDPGLGSSVWFVNSSALSGTLYYQWGLAGDTPIQGNFTGGLGADIAVYRPSIGTWFVRGFTSDLKFNGQPTQYQWGLSGDTPLACDFDGDSGRSDLTVYRPTDGYWYTRKSSASPAFSTATAQQWGGISGDRPVPKDFDTDGKCDHTVFRRGSWYVLLSSTSGSEAGVVEWGASGDVPVPGKYDSDSVVDFAVFRPSNSVWYIRKSNLAGLTSKAYQWGLSGDIPVPADYTGDGKTDIAVWRPSNGTYYILKSDSNFTTATAQQFGLSSDIPFGDTKGSL